MQSPFPSPLQKRDEGIAPSLSRSYVVFGIQSVLRATPTPFKTRQNFVSLYLPVVAIDISKGLPCYPAWLPLRVTPATPEVHLLPTLVIVHNRCISLPLTSRGSAASLIITRLPIGSLSLQPAGLLGPLNEPLSGNLVLRVTPCTSLSLHG